MGEYIEREAAIAALDEFRGDQTVSKYATVMQCKAARDAISRAIKVLESLPAADVGPVQEWISVKDRLYSINELLASENAALKTEIEKIGRMNDGEE